jgi:GAF domain-containing protein
MQASVDDIVREAKEMLTSGAPRQKILASLTSAAETVAGTGAVSSILVLDEQGLLRNGASPGLPGDYLKAIDKLKPDANVGTCAVTAATGNITITPDFYADEKWKELRHLPLALGFLSAWSAPIQNADGKVLGTFGTYYRERRRPTDVEINTVKELAAVAASVIAE